MEIWNIYSKTRFLQNMFDIGRKEIIILKQEQQGKVEYDAAD